VLNAYAVGFVGGVTPSIAGVSLVGIIGQVWSLHWEWLFYLVVPFLAAVLARRSWTLAALGFAALCAAYQLSASAQYWPFFLPGMVCGVLSDKIKIGAGAQAILLATGAASVCAALLGGFTPYGFAQLGLCSAGFAGLIFGHKWLLSVRPLRMLGEVSYSIYLVHLFGPTLFWMGVHFFAPEELRPVDAKYQLALMLVPVTLAISFLTYALIERPFMARRPTGRGATAPGIVSVVRRAPEHAI
jgi:peptidoglycan/LPS O-acetylase OafA/YrhL